MNAEETPNTRRCTICAVNFPNDPAREFDEYLEKEEIECLRNW